MWRVKPHLDIYVPDIGSRRWDHASNTAQHPVCHGDRLGEAIDKRKKVRGGQKTMAVPMQVGSITFMPMLVLPLYVELLHPGTYTGHNMVNKRDLHALMTDCSTCVLADKHGEAKGQPGFPYLHVCYDSYLSYLAKYQSLQAETLHAWRVLQLLYICNTARARYKILDNGDVIHEVPIRYIIHVHIG